MLIRTSLPLLSCSLVLVSVIVMFLCSRRLHQSGAVVTKWAMEYDPPAARAFEHNFPEASVFTDDCNDLLASIMAGKDTIKGKALPQKGK